MNGIDVRQTVSQLVFRTLYLTGAGSAAVSGTTTLHLYELQTADGTLKSFDFSTSAFSTGALTSAFTLMSAQSGNNNTTSTGLWTARVSGLSGFTSGNIYFAWASSTSGSPQIQCREFQFGGAQGDMVTVSGNIQAHVASYATNVYPGVKRNQHLSSFQFLMTDSTNHAPVTGLTVSCVRSVDAGSYISGHLASVGEVSFGMYRVTFSATDLSGANTILMATATGADTRFVTLVTGT